MLQAEQKREDRNQTGKAYTDNLYPLGKKAFYQGRLAESAAFICRNQLKDRGLWAKFVAQFGRPSDDADGGWRGEFWGKLMRAACLTYKATGNAKLYAEITESIKDMLTTADLAVLNEAYRNTKAGLEAVMDSEIAGTVYNDKEGQAGAMARIALALLTGEGLEDVEFQSERCVYLPYEKVTKGNVSEYLMRSR